jgi:hypothetical protein
VKNLTWQNPGQLFVAQELIKIVKLKCCGIKVQIIKTLSKMKTMKLWTGIVLPQNMVKNPSLLQKILIL